MSSDATSFWGYIQAHVTQLCRKASAGGIIWAPRCSAAYPPHKSGAFPPFLPQANKSYLLQVDMRDAAYEPVDAIVLEADLRADFPHDAWWESGILSFSDGSSCQVKFEKTGLPQRFDIGECKIE